MTSTTRVPAIEIDGFYGAMVKTFSKKMLGKVPDSLGVLWHHKPALKATMALGQKSRKWNEVDLDLKSFAHMAVAAGGPDHPHPRHAQSAQTDGSGGGNGAQPGCHRLKLVPVFIRWRESPVVGEH